MALALRNLNNHSNNITICLTFTAALHWCKLLRTIFGLNASHVPYITHFPSKVGLFRSVQ